MVIAPRTASAVRTMRMSRQIVIVGGGIIGLATALRLLQRRPGARVLLVEKEAGPGRHQTTHNSGVLHAGLYYAPGSLKARLCREGLRDMVQFCRENGVAHEICGKLVVATTAEEAIRLQALHQRGLANGLTGLRLLDPAEMREREPHVGGVAGLLVPEEGIVDYAQVTARLVERIGALGGTFQWNTRVGRMRLGDDGWRLELNQGEIAADFLIGCAGLYSDRVARAAGEKIKTQIVPFRGEYFRLREEKQDLVRHLIYPVPDPEFPFLGVHFTRLMGGGIEAGPNAVLALAREAYRKGQFDPGELVEALAFPGLWRFLHRHRAMCWAEMQRSWNKQLFCRSLQRLVPAIQPEDLEEGGAGVRAQAMTRAGDLVQDFAIVQNRRALHVINAPSPAATASLAIGAEIVARLDNDSATLL